MDYVLFLNFKRFNTSFYFNIEEAEEAINGVGVWSICGVIPENGKLRVISRKTIVRK